jgi:hypothetical protein
MSRRGSAQLLLLSFRSHRARTWMIGTVVGAVAAVALVQTAREPAFPGGAGLVQALHQSAWQYALAGLPETPLWPWAEGLSEPAASVPRLGLSASLVKIDAGKDGDTRFAPGPAQDPHLPQTKLGDVNIGDHITVTRADGSSRVYRVTGRNVVDPHLADCPPESSDGNRAPEACLSTDSVLADSLQLVIQAPKNEAPAAAAPGPEL